MLQESYSFFRYNVEQHRRVPQLALVLSELIKMCNILPKKRRGYKIISLLKILIKESPPRKFRNTESPNDLEWYSRILLCFTFDQYRQVHQQMIQSLKFLTRRRHNDWSSSCNSKKIQKSSNSTWSTFFTFWMITVNQFVPNAPFPYPLKTSENLMADKGCTGSKWVKKQVSTIGTKTIWKPCLSHLAIS